MSTELPQKELSRPYYSRIETLIPNSNGCLIWKGSSARQYPIIAYHNVVYYLHRRILADYYNISYDDKSWVAMHLCNNRSCVNIKHLMVGTNSLNMLDAANKRTHKESRKTHCDSGHPFDSINTVIDNRGKRVCKACRSIRDKLRNTSRITINGKRVRTYSDRTKS